MNAIIGILYSFPIQLLILHLKKHHFLLFIWLILLLLVTSTMGSHYGINYLLLDPEYLGKVNSISFFITGTALGGFVVSWNITCYILHAHRFPFLATLERPFGVFFLNNSVIPIFFTSVYAYNIVQFQKYAEFQNTTGITMDLLGLFGGIILILILAGTYFFQTNKDIWQQLGLKKEDEPIAFKINPDVKERPGWMWSAWRVDYYVSMFLRVRIVRSVTHYDGAHIHSVYKQHHGNAVFIELTGLGLLIGLGMLIDYAAFRIPAGASMLILFGLILALTGAFSYWIRGWRAAMYILLLLSMNSLMRNDMFNHKNKAYGLDYETAPAAYTRETLEELSSSALIESDRAYMLQILENWAVKNRALSGAEKPPLVLINSSGGGLRASLFTTRVLQAMDSVTGDNILDHAFLMTGASGGMLGAAYYRELHLKRGQENIAKKSDPENLSIISKDLLNPILFAIVVNDLFFPWQKFETGGYTYRKDRAYVFEKQFNDNTNYLLDKSIGEYREPEFNQEIPLMILAPTIINDERKCFISPHPVSWLTRPLNNNGTHEDPLIDGVDFGRLFKDNDADGLRMTSALRMNATFPYILPNVSLPSDPLIEVMDAGIRDNFGMETSTRFIYTFKDWLKENTSGVILIEIRGHEQFEKIKDQRGQSFISKIFNPVGNLYANWNEVQDYQHDFLLDYASEFLDGKFEVIVFEYTAESEKEKASVNFRLTRREQQSIIGAVDNAHNQAQLEKLVDRLGPHKSADLSDN